MVRIEQSALGTVFVCTYGGAKHGVSGCHRTYLSHRDLQSHMTHRHLSSGGGGGSSRQDQPIMLQHEAPPAAQLKSGGVGGGVEQAGGQVQIQVYICSSLSCSSQYTSSCTY